MASQNAAGISVFYDYDQQSVRLLELPADVSASLSNASAPTLSLKSAASAGDGGKSAEALVLCTDDKTFAIKQVSSSNSLMLLRPFEANATGDAPNIGLLAFAKCGGMLEALPLPADSSRFKSPKDFLIDLLPTYDESHDGVTPKGSTWSRQELYASIPYSNGEIDRVWKEGMAFETSAQCYRPVSSTSLALWSALLVSTTAQGSDLSKPTTIEQLKPHCADYPEPLLESLIRRVRPDETGLEVRLDADKTIDLVGSLLLLRRQEGLSLSEQDNVVEEWRSLLPEKWRAEATADRLHGLAEFIATDSSSGSGSAVKPDSTKRKAASARNWHDKFKRSRT